MPDTWQSLRGNWLSNRLFETNVAIIEDAGNACNRLIAQPETVTSIGMRDWVISVNLNNRQ
jgi:hypothetical protein